MLGGEGVSNENELLEPLATEAGQQAIARAINNLSSLEYAVRAERAATNAAQSADEALNSANDASDSEEMARKWATKTDGYVAQETITIPPEQEGDEPTTETIDLFSARYYAELAQDIYNNMSFDSVPTENSNNMVNSGVVYSALNLKADKSTTYTKTETDNLINTRLAELVASAPAALDTLQELATALGNDPNFATTIATQLGNKADKSTTYTKTEVDTALSAKADQSTTYTKTEVDTALSNVQSTLTFDNVPTANSDNPVKSSGIKTALDGKQDTLTFDSTPTANSTNPVTSGGVYTALQNVDIDVDTSITQNSTNPVTSAAIYEALQNFTPSGGGGAGNASGVTVDVLYEDLSSGYSSGTLTLSKEWDNYDFIVFTHCHPDQTSSGSGSNKLVLIPVIYRKEILNQVYENNGHVILTGYGTRFMSLNCGNDKKTFTISERRDTNILGVYGYNISKNLSEQMYSNVLYENSSGWSNGSITLSDALDNYDFIQCDYRNAGDPSQYINSNIFDAKLLLDGRFLSIVGFDSRYFNATVTSSTVLTLLTRGDYVLTKITGYKIAKGGYSGIVSDARMTVKSGFLDLSSGLAGNRRHDFTITFDSPMPDTNYEVMTEKVGFVDKFDQTYPTITDKTVNGFTISIYQNSTRNSDNINSGLSWVAIRPNSYTREGMVEDVLFSNANGVNSGTINLSGNISDYDLIQFDVHRSTAEIVHKFTTSGVLLNLDSNNYYMIDGFDNDYLDINDSTDSSLVIGDSRNLKIIKITGIKFGRYVSGVAVDTTVTQNSNAVVTSGAVYDALQNYTPSGGGSSVTVDTEITSTSQNPVTSQAIYEALQNIPSGGGSGGSITVDTTITENSQNPVTSAAIYTALAGKQDTLTIDSTPTQNSINPIQSGAVYDIFMQTSAQEFSSKVPTNMKTETANSVLYAQSGRTYYKKNNGVAAGIITRVGNFVKAILVSPISDNTLSISSYNTSTTNTPTTITYDGKTYYVDTNPYQWERRGSWVSEISSASIPVVNQTFSTEEDAGRYILNLVFSSGKTLSDYNITNAYTKTEVDTALGSKQGTLTFDTTPTQNSTNPVTSGGVYTALQNLPTGTGDVTTNTDQNITGTKTFVGSKKVAFKQSTTNDKLGFTLFGNTGTERGYLEFNPTNTIDGVAGLMTLGNYATSAASLTQVGFRRYSNISGANGAYNLLTPLIADAKSPFSLTTTYTNFYLPLGFTDGTTTVRTAKSGLVDLSPLLASLEARIAALEGN